MSADARRRIDEADRERQAQRAAAVERLRGSMATGDMLDCILEATGAGRGAMAAELVPGYAGALTPYTAHLVPLLVRAGWADDEILDHLRDREPAPSSADLAARRRQTLREQRATAAYLAALRGPRPGGAPSGTGLTWDAIVDKAAEMWQPDDPPPTADAVAEALGCSGRYQRRLTAPHGGWRAVLDAVMAART